MKELQVLARKVMFSCMHRYAVEDWSDSKNLKTFGPCFSKHGHGHNYTLEGYFEGDIDPTTGMIINLTVVDQWLTRSIESVNGKFLNNEVEFFRNRVPTTENLLIYIKQNLEEELKGQTQVQLYQLRLYESETLWVDWKKKH